MEKLSPLEKSYSSSSSSSGWTEEVIDVLGEAYPLMKYKSFWFSPPHVPGTEEALKNFKPLPSDVILVSFPKTGTTWLKSLLFSIINRSSSSKQSLAENHPHDLVPQLEVQLCGPNSSTTDPNSSSPRRIINTHIPYQLLAESLDSSDCKVVYVTRNPKDTIVSFWHFWNKSRSHVGEEPWPLQVIVDAFCGGFAAYGPYFDHVLGGKKVSLERPNKVFFITYEELKNDAKNHVKRLAEFLGCPVDKEDELEEIVKSCSIETLKTHQVNKSDQAPSWFPIALPYSSYFRKGQVGDYQNCMSKEMIDLVDTTTIEKFGGLSYEEVTSSKGTSGK